MYLIQYICNNIIKIKKNHILFITQAKAYKSSKVPTHMLLSRFEWTMNHLKWIFLAYLPFHHRTHWITEKQNSNLPYTNLNGNQTSSSSTMHSFAGVKEKSSYKPEWWKPNVHVPLSLLSISFTFLFRGI